MGRAPIQNPAELDTSNGVAYESFLGLVVCLIEETIWPWLLLTFPKPLHPFLLLPMRQVYYI